MMKHCLSLPLAAAVCAAVSAQDPQLSMHPAVQVSAGGTVVSAALAAPAGAAFAMFVDLDGGPVDVLGERFYLGATPNLTIFMAGVMPASGSALGSVTLPLIPGLAGQVVYGQGLTFDASAANGIFRVSNGASSALWTGVSRIAAGFDSASSNGYTGTFASDVAGHLAAAPVSTRTHVTIDPVGNPISAGLRNPLNPFGCREQMVYRAQDVGATGEPELLTSVRWRPLPATVSSESYSQFQLRIGHTQVTPDYTIDSFSALPVAPQSGLVLTFAANELPGVAPQVVYSGVYSFDASHLTSSGFLPYPMAAPFAYDGVSSLLLDFRTWPSTTAGATGVASRVMVQSHWLPNGRVALAGSPSNPIQPQQAAVADFGDNTMAELEMEFVRVESHVLSPWLDSQLNTPDYGAPILGRSLPPGTSITVQYRGSHTPTGALPTAWSSSPDGADGRRYLQFRVTLLVDRTSGARPVLDTLVVPAN